jgi:hypothetical protein
MDKLSWKGCRKTQQPQPKCARERQNRETPRATSRDVRREREKIICARFLCFEGVAEAGSLICCPPQILEIFSAPLLVKNYSFDVQFWYPPPHIQNPVPLLLLLLLLLIFFFFLLFVPLWRAHGEARGTCRLQRKASTTKTVTIRSPIILQHREEILSEL